MRVCLVLILATGVAAAEPCPRFGLEPYVLTPANAKITSDGGIVVGTRSRMGEDVGTGEIAVQPDWRIVGDGKRDKPTVDVIAPGLAVYRAPAKASAIVLENGKRAKLGSASVAAKIDALEAPRVKAVVQSRTREKHSTTSVGVELDGAPPKTAIALVLARDDGTPMSWGAPGVESTVLVYTTLQGCGTFPNGTLLAAPGDRVVAFWIDAAGRRSPQSPKLVVTSK